MDLKSFQFSNNSTEIDFCPKTSCSQIDSALEEKLNDIDEFIQCKLGFAQQSDGGPLTTTEVNELRCFLPTGKQSNESLLWTNPENVEASLMTGCESSNKVPEVEIEVQIMNLKDVYNKKTKKNIEGLEYRLEDSEVTVVVQASDEITSVRAYTRRCPEAALRTHDTVGPVELDVHTVQSEERRWVVTVDLGSVYKTEDGDPVYWLEKAEVLQRNKWELIIAMEFSSGLAGKLTSRPFRVTTKASCKMRRKAGLAAGSCKVQRLFRKITGFRNSGNSVTDHEDYRRHKYFPNSKDKKELKEFSWKLDDNSATQPLAAENSRLRFNSRSVPPIKKKVLFQPYTVLDRHMVTTYYGREESIHRAFEQPELPGLLKLVGKQSKLVSPRKKANGHRSDEEDFWWACGHCFFERRKKSTIKDHLIQRVCQKSIENKKSRGKLQCDN